MDFDVFEILAKQAERDYPRQPEDYEGEDGLLCCGRCHTPKQRRISEGEFTGKYAGRIVYCACECVAEKQRQEKEAEEARKRRERVRDLKERCFDSVSMEALTFANDNGTVPVMEAARKYVDNFFEGENFERDGRGLLLWGYPGTGKSYAAAAICNALCEKEVSCRYVSMGQVLADLRGFREDQAEYMDRLNHARLLVIDDLGSERETEYASEIVFGVIDARSRTRRPMIVTTNLSIEKIKRPETEAQRRIYSRILGMCHPVEVVGQDQRKLAAAARYADIKAILGM